MQSNKLDVTEITRYTYDEIASGYVQSITQLVSDSWVGSFEKSLLDKFIGFLPESSDSGLNILDIGCGNGKDSFYLSQKTGVFPFGVDYSTGMLSEARKAFPDIDFFQMDMRQLALVENCFYGVWANGCIYHVPKKNVPQVFLEVRRVLKPKGIFSLNFKLGAGEQLEQNPKSYGGKPRFYAYYEIEEMKSILSRTDFTIMEIEHYPEEIFKDKIVHIWVTK